MGCGSQADAQQLAKNRAAMISDGTPIELALKFVEFIQPDGSPILQEVQVQTLITKVNTYYSKCNIVFNLEEYRTVQPSQSGLNFNASSVDDMASYRKPFDDSRYLVVIHTGAWNHSKMGPANAWTAMPGEVPAGAVIEGHVATFAGLVGHELGHYLGLDHKAEMTNLMNPVIYGNSTYFTSEQCIGLRTGALTSKSSALRELI